MKFSVVIPLFNKQSHIVRTINSVLGQTHEKFELIIVDDGSTDDSYDRANRIKDDRIRLIRQMNSGVSAARNRGIEEAKNEYIAFLDADDTWEKDYLKSINELIINYSEAAVFGTSYQYYNSRKDVYPNKSYYKFPENWMGIIDNFFMYIDYPIICASCVTVKKSALDKIGGFNVNLKLGEDRDVWCRLALNYKIAYYNRLCAVYHRDSENMVTRNKIDIEKSFSNYVEELYLENEKYNNQSMYFREYMIRTLVLKIGYLIVNNEKREARQLIYKYRKTKLHKTKLVKAYLYSFLPVSLIDALRNVRKKLNEVINE